MNNANLEGLLYGEVGREMGDGNTAPGEPSSRHNISAIQ